MRYGVSDAIRLSCLAAVALASAAAAQGFGVLVRPPHVYVTADAASTVRERIALMPTAEDAAVAVTSSFFDVDEQGAPQHGDGGDRSILPWMSIDPARFVLVTGQSALVDLELRIPAFATGSYWGAILVDTQPLKSTSALEVQPRIVIPVVVTVRGTEQPRIHIDEVRAFRSAENAIVIAGVVTNHGNVVLRAPLTAAIERVDAAGVVEVGSSEDVAVFVLPGRRREFRITIGGDFDALGALRATVWLRFGSRPSELVERACEVVPQEPCTVACVRG